MTFPSDDDIEWLRQNQPRLFSYTTPRGDIVIKGTLQVYKTHDGHLIEDNYKIRVAFAKDDNYAPVATETGGRLQAVMQARDIDNPVALHMYKNYQLCLMAPQEMALRYLPNKSFELLAETYLIPYFYSQSYYEHNDGRWPWVHFSHDHTGILEWYIQHHTIPGAAQETIKVLKEWHSAAYDRFVKHSKQKEAFNPASKCICGSGRTYKQCSNQHAILTKLVIPLRAQG